MESSTSICGFGNINPPPSHGTVFGQSKEHSRQAGRQQCTVSEEFPTGSDVRTLHQVMPCLRRGVVAFRETIASRARIAGGWSQERPNGKNLEAQRVADPGPEASGRS